MFADVPWHALHTEQKHLGILGQCACRYDPAVAPFAALADHSEEALSELATLLIPDETVYVFSDVALRCSSLATGEPLRCLQMIAPGPAAEVVGSSAGPQIVPLGPADADEMVALTNLAYPGFFRRRTHEMGCYFGVRIEGTLVAMAGERMALPGHHEISGVCTHPSHTGRGYAARLISRVMQENAAAGLTSFLHVAAGNTRAIELYERLGFVTRREITLQALRSK
jgi:ribosomal protein S18 acetylase RimI-like enzyme